MISHGSFVGRHTELTVLRSAVDAANAGHGSTWFLRGEPGVGKTRLALEVQRAAQQLEMITAIVTSWDLGGAPPYWPWIELLRAVEAADPQRRPAPDLTAGTLESEGDRFARFDEVRRYLRAVASDQPILLILDDLHSADLATLLLTRFVAGGTNDSRLLVIGTYRPVEIALRDDADDRPTEHLEAAARFGGSIDLAGLSFDEVDQMIGSAVAAPLRDSAVPRIFELTGGNPLFVRHLAPVIADRDPRSTDPLDVPAGIRELFAQRFARLDAHELQLLRVAAVIGTVSRLDLLAAVVGETVDAVTTGVGRAQGVSRARRSRSSGPDFTCSESSRVSMSTALRSAGTPSRLARSSSCSSRPDEPARLASA